MVDKETLLLLVWRVTINANGALSLLLWSVIMIANMEHCPGC